MPPLIYDAVTLQHFGVLDRLDICQQLHGALGEPHWTETVAAEVRQGSKNGYTHCTRVLAAGWLGDPIAPEASDHRGIQRFRVSLGAAFHQKNEGEAESIYFAEKLGGSFATDDRLAYSEAIRHLGPGRVLDTVYILRDAVVEHLLTPRDAAELANKLVIAGRSLRTNHTPPFSDGYFL